MRLKGLDSMQVLDSNGNYTILVRAFTKDNSASAVVPSGSSAGSGEIKVINSFEAVNKVKRLSPVLKGKELSAIDSLITNEPGNVSTGISIAVQKLIAKERGKEYYELLGGNTLPVPFMNIINGGVHAGNKLSFQEFMIVPRAKSFSDSIMMSVEVYQRLKDFLTNKYGKQSVNVGMEGGFAPPMKNVEEPLRIITKVLSSLGYSNEVGLAIDVAANQLFYSGKYLVNGKRLTRDKLISYYERLAIDYGLLSIEDPFEERDFQSFSELTQSLKGVKIVGDDLTVSNPLLVERAINEKSCNTLLLKINQVGTVTKALESVSLASNNNWGVMVSHRSGDSCDSFIADLAVGLNCGMIKTGAPARGERVAKYNRLLEIENKLGSKERF